MCAIISTQCYVTIFKEGMAKFFKNLKEKFFTKKKISSKDYQDVSNHSLPEYESSSSDVGSVEFDTSSTTLKEKESQYNTISTRRDAVTDYNISSSRKKSDSVNFYKNLDGGDIVSNEDKSKESGGKAVKEQVGIEEYDSKPKKTPERDDDGFEQSMNDFEQQEYGGDGLNEDGFKGVIRHHKQFMEDWNQSRQNQINSHSSKNSKVNDAMDEFFTAIDSMPNDEFNSIKQDLGQKVVDELQNQGIDKLNEYRKGYDPEKKSKNYKKYTKGMLKIINAQESFIKDFKSTYDIKDKEKSDEKSPKTKYTEMVSEKEGGINKSSKSWETREKESSKENGAGHISI